MKKTFIYILFVSVIAFTSCDSYYNPGEHVATLHEDTTQFKTDFDILMRFIPNSGDYINTKKAPSMISANDVHDNLSKYFVIDLREKKDYMAGHINGAVNIQMHELLDYLDEYVAASTFEKLIFVSNTGQKASYVTSVMRMIGYDNAYAMKYGMSAWNKSLDMWSKNVSNKYANKLEMQTRYKAKEGTVPEIETGADCGAEILQARARTLLNTPFEKLKINADRAFNDESFYIISYWPEAKYEKGHIPGSIQYTPRKDLKFSTNLKTLPADKKILVYCNSGFHSAYVTAYLRLLGYNAFSLSFGANGFMHSSLLARQGWHGFDAKKVLNDFALIMGENPTDKAFEKQLNIANETEKKSAPKKVVKRKKKEVEGGCG
jgi:rhodanese-related sulfurtransferase